MKSLHIFLSVFLCLLLLLSVSQACAKVHIQSTCYNSEAMVTENVMTNNADYSSVTILLPYSGYAGLPFSILSNGAGESVDKEFSEFAHSILAANKGDFESIAASLKTESGEFEWEKGVTASSQGLYMGMSVGCEIENGNLEAFYRNSLSSHTEELMTNGARYSESTIITPNAIASDGVGNSLLKQVEKESKSEDDETDKEKSDGNLNDNFINKNQDESADADNYSEDENMDSGFYHKVRVESQGKWTEIRTNLTCESIDFKWEKSAKTVHQNSSMGMLLEGGGKNGSVKIFEMDGEWAPNHHQHLPPGRFGTNNPTDEDVEDFYDEFSQYPVALFYSIEQECFVPPGKDYQPLIYDIGEGEYFRLNMNFFPGQDENGEG